MSTPEGRVNFDLFQVQKVGGHIEIAQGMAVVQADSGELYVDPQQEPDNPDSYGWADDESLILGVGRWLADTVTADGRLYRASLSLKDQGPHAYNLREPFGSEQLSHPYPNAAGTIALLGIAEHEDFTIIDFSERDPAGAHILHRADITGTGRREHPHKANIVALGDSGEISIAHGRKTDQKVSTLEYDSSTKTLRVEDRGDDQDDTKGDEGGPGPNSGDSEPRKPITPHGSAGAEAETPEEVRRLVLQGQVS